MNKRRKNVLAIIEVVILLGTGISFAVEPSQWKNDPSQYQFWKYFVYNADENLSASLNITNFTTSEGNFSLMLETEAGGEYNHTVPDGYTWSINIFNFEVLIKGSRLSFPFTAVSLVGFRPKLSSSGPIVMNVTPYNDSNILTALDGSHVGYGDGSGGGYYQIDTNYNYTTMTANYLREGNYTMNFTLSFTPVFEVGPYIVYGNRLSVYHSYHWRILPQGPNPNP